jgi:hypothetical protein
MTAEPQAPRGDGRVAEWQSGRVAEWQSGRVAGLLCEQSRSESDCGRRSNVGSGGGGGGKRLVEWAEVGRTSGSKAEVVEWQGNAPRGTTGPRRYAARVSR